ncbi:hypothetical protein [Streptomyces sp. TRM49041]|uniref:hypothetical protein n=1 Tax=Streptomyces sp. TRM49041 TaxID=2603216 RepID=UPI0011EE3706|nr:hypothetical protein [Streptomyces sp. TRM49041]
MDAAGAGEGSPLPSATGRDGSEAVLVGGGVGRGVAPGDGRLCSGPVSARSRPLPGADGLPASGSVLRIDSGFDRGAAFSWDDCRAIARAPATPMAMAALTRV